MKILVKFYLKFKSFYSRKCIGKCCLQNVFRFVQNPVCWLIHAPNLGGGLQMLVNSSSRFKSPLTPNTRAVTWNITNISWTFVSHNWSDWLIFLQAEEVQQPTTISEPLTTILASERASETVFVVSEMDSGIQDGMVEVADANVPASLLAQLEQVPQCEGQETLLIIQDSEDIDGVSTLVEGEGGSQQVYSIVYTMEDTAWSQVKWGMSVSLVAISGIIMLVKLTWTLGTT